MTKKYDSIFNIVKKCCKFFAQIFDKSKLLGMPLHPYTLSSYTTGFWFRVKV